MYRDKSSIAGLRACFYFNTYSIPITCQFLLVMYIYFRPALTFAFIFSIQGDSYLAENIIYRHSCKRIIKGQVFFANPLFTYKVTFYIFTMVTITWLSVLFLLAGDIHPNSGPLSTSSTSSIPDSSWTHSSVFNFSNLSNHLSFVHYNVQSLVPKLDILGTELFEWYSSFQWNLAKSFCPFARFAHSDI